jgi:hypothetical protein
MSCTANSFTSVRSFVTLVYPVIELVLQHKRLLGEICQRTKHASVQSNELLPRAVAFAHSLANDNFLKCQKAREREKIEIFAMLECTESGGKRISDCATDAYCILTAYELSTLHIYGKIT